MDKSDMICLVIALIISAGAIIIGITIGKRQKKAVTAGLSKNFPFENYSRLLTNAGYMVTNDSPTNICARHPVFDIQIDIEKTFDIESSFKQKCMAMGFSGYLCDVATEKTREIVINKQTVAVLVDTKQIIIGENESVLLTIIADKDHFTEAYKMLSVLGFVN